MPTRLASCSCGQLTAQVTGEPVRISICHCLASTVYYEPEGLEAFLAIPVGAFADPNFPSPVISIYESRMHQWVVPPPGAEHIP